VAKQTRTHFLLSGPCSSSKDLFNQTSVFDI
jgi:hypothetical protein